MEVDKSWREADRAASRFLPITGREIGRKERDLLRVARHLPDPMRWFSDYDRRLSLIGQTLVALDPERPLACGYALVSKNGVSVMRASELKAGDRIELTFADNKRDATIV